MSKKLIGVILATVFVLAPGFVLAQGKDLAIAAFFGVYSGAGVAESSETPRAATMRDSVLEIRPAEGGGFSIAWSTTTRNPGKEAKVKTTQAAFRPTAKLGVFEAVQQGNPMTGGDYMWARVSRQTLTVYAMTTGDDGRYEIQKWDRTLQGLGMQMVYTRISDGEQSRIVRARLVKDKK